MKLLILLALTACTPDYECSDWKWRQCYDVCKADGKMSSYDFAHKECTCIQPKQR